MKTALQTFLNFTTATCIHHLPQVMYSELVKTSFKSGTSSCNQEVTTEEINDLNISHFTEAYTEILSTRQHKLTCKDIQHIKFAITVFASFTS
jgi:hypothetical protein